MVVCLCAGSPSGFAFNNSNYDNSNANAGSRSHLCSKYTKDKDLAPWQKITYSKGVGSITRRLRIEKQSTMKRVGNLFDKVCTLDNLYLAYSKAKQGKSRRYGDNRYVVKIKQDGIESKFFTNATPIKDALDRIEKKDFPFLATIKQQKFGGGSGKTFYFT